MIKTALITGASSGIGKDLAYIHAKEGGDLILVARSADKLENLKAKLEKDYGIKVLVISQDLTEPGACNQIYETVKSDGMKVDYLINNAGFGGYGKFHERNWQDDLNMIQLNVIALCELTHLYLQDFTKANSGKILNVSSTASLMPGPLQAVYFATKAFVSSFSNALCEELRDTEVTVTTLMPGATETDFAKSAGMEKSDLFKNSFSSYEVAEDGYNAMLRGDMEILSGLSSTQKFMMKTMPFAPKKMVMRQVRKLQEF